MPTTPPSLGDSTFKYVPGPLTIITDGDAGEYQKAEGWQSSKINNLKPAFVQTPLTVTTRTLPNGTAGIPYSQTLTVNGTVSFTFIWSVIRGGLPDGLALNSATGTISEIPAASRTSKTFDFAVRVSHPFENATQSLAIEIDSPYTTPTKIAATSGGVEYKAELQTDGKTYLIILPPDTDITDLPLAVELRPGATVTPRVTGGATFDFSDGPLESTITAPDTSAKRTIFIEARAAQPAPAEREWFAVLPSTCEIAYVTSADATVAASLRIPFTPLLNPDTVKSVRATIAGLTVANVSYGYRDASGNFHPIESKTLSTAAPFAKAPYLQIAFTAPSLSDIKKGKLEKIECWLKGDDTEYVQTYKTPLEFAAIMPIDETPIDEPEPDPDPDSDPEPEPDPDPANSDKESGGGCSAGAAGIWAPVVLAPFLRANARLRPRLTRRRPRHIKQR